MRRTRKGSRQGHQNHHRHHQSDDNWSVQPLHDALQESQHDPEQEPEESNLNPPSTSSTSNLQRFPDFTQKPRKNNRNRKYQHGLVPKARLVTKSELTSLESELNFEDSKGTSAVVVVDELNGEDRREVLESKSEENGKGIEDDDDAVSRLEKVRLIVEEPELSEEELRINEQLQEDEVIAGNSVCFDFDDFMQFLVMKSIFGEKVLILNGQKGLRTLQIHINLECIGETIVTTKLDSSTHGGVEKETLDDFSYSFKVQYLPPIVLTCLLPRSYPSHLPPYFNISVQWLHSARISELCSQLDSLWKEQEGQEIIYQWVEWLQNFSLSYLGFDKEIMLGPYGIQNTGERRAISGSVSPDVDVPFIRNYNDEKFHDNFLQSLHECSICFSEYAGTDFIRLPCRHFFCWKCMKTYSNMHISEGTISKLQCPEDKCGGMVPPGLLRRLLGDEGYERWESLMLQKTLESMSDVAYCPRCETPCIEDEDQHAQCSKCFFSFCTLCRERRHVGIACMTPEIKLRVLQERQKFAQLNENQKRKEREMMNEILSMKVIMRDAKQCPSCKMAISRTEGCNKMVCTNCGQYFCYLCNNVISGYDHFRDGECDLFPPEAIRLWEERMNAGPVWEGRMNQRQVVGQYLAQEFADHRLPCPNCRQFNAKVGNNNHIFCWACQMHYCYLCRKIVRRSTEHYGPRGCKQHTEG